MRKKIFFIIGISVTIMFSLSIFAINVNADYKFNYHDHDEIVTLLEDLETQSSSLTPDVFSLQIIGYSHLG
ncbi:MAG: hypothetical protein KAQ81_00490, partial [Deltaproteobacteria bacterium]|nr:hypothetical protein [Deltaproteobacteria bacterium]